MSVKMQWSKIALMQLINALEYIKEDSPQNSLQVEKDILEKLEKVIKNPESCSPDQYRVNNHENNYRAFELHKLRVSYFVGKGVVRIIRVRNVKMKPLNY